MELLRETSIRDYKGTNRKYAIFKCIRCGQEKEMPKRYGIIANTCGCKIDYTGIVVNNYLIVKDYKGARREVLAKCPVCGNNKKMLMQTIKGNKAKSCGCISTNLTAQANFRHGLCEHRIYKIHRGMVQRCYNKNAKVFKNYGFKGISICDEWKNNFISFYNWAIENGYKDNLSIDRINNNGNYEPSNCRWADDNIQARNTKRLQKNNTSGYRGVSLIKERKLYAARITVNKVVHRLGTHKEAIECAKIYDNYIIDNNLEHTKNFS